MTICVTTYCRRQATDGFRTCEHCRVYARERVTRNRLQGLCHDWCAKPRIAGYSRCVRCVKKHLERIRVHHGYSNIATHLYLATVGLGIKVGCSSDVPRRMGQLNAELIKASENKGHLEPLVHHELGAYRVAEGGSREVFSCDVATIEAAVERVIARDLVEQRACRPLYRKRRWRKLRSRFHRRARRSRRARGRPWRT